MNIYNKRIIVQGTVIVDQNIVNENGEDGIIAMITDDITNNIVSDNGGNGIVDGRAIAALNTGDCNTFFGILPPFLAPANTLGWQFKFFNSRDTDINCYVSCFYHFNINFVPVIDVFIATSFPVVKFFM